MIGKVDIKVPSGLPEFFPIRGARKRAVARVWLWERKEGGEEPEIYVNRVPYKKYFAGTFFDKIVEKPLVIADRVSKYVAFATVKGGGPSAQAQAVAHGIARALCALEPELRKVLKPHGLLTRDPREVERKKYGRRKARKKQQWKKR